MSESDIIDRRISDIQNIFTERFKQSIINEYLKENPGVRRDEVIERIHNGQVVIDTIDNVFQEISRRERITESFKDKKLYELLQIEQDDRYKACLASIRNSERIIQYLFTSNYAPFGLAEKNQALNYLTHKERVCANWTANYYKATKDIFTLMMSHYTVPAAKVQGLISLYFTALHQQLLCQREIYMKELGSSSCFPVSPRPCANQRQNHPVQNQILPEKRFSCGHAQKSLPRDEQKLLIEPSHQG